MRSLILLMTFSVLSSGLDARDTRQLTKTLVETQLVDVTLSKTRAHASQRVQTVVGTQVADMGITDSSIERLGVMNSREYARSSTTESIPTAFATPTDTMTVFANDSWTWQARSSSTLTLSGFRALMSMPSSVKKDSIMIDDTNSSRRRQMQLTWSCSSKPTNTTTESLTRLVNTNPSVLFINGSVNLLSTTDLTPLDESFGMTLSTSSTGSTAVRGDEVSNAATIAVLRVNKISTVVTKIRRPTFTGQDGYGVPLNTHQVQRVFSKSNNSISPTTSARLKPSTVTTQLCKSGSMYNYTQIALFTMPPPSSLLIATSDISNAAKTTFGLILTDTRVNATYTYGLPEEVTLCPETDLPIGWDLTCGEANHEQICPGMMCCGHSQLCGTSQDYCRKGCRKEYGLCWHDDDNYGPDLTNAIGGVALAGALGLDCVDMCELALPKPKDPACLPYPVGCPPGKGGDDSSSGGDGEREHEGYDHTDAYCDEFERRIATYRTTHCVRYLHGGNTSPSTTCTRTETSTKAGCDVDGGSSATEWTTADCNTANDLIAASAFCEQFAVSGWEGAETVSRGCTTRAEELTECEFSPTITTTKTCEPTQTMTDHKYYCSIGADTAGNGKPACTESISKTTSGCIMKTSPTLRIQSCPNFAGMVSPDDDYGMEPRCKVHSMPTATDVVSSCFVRLSNSDAHPSIMSGSITRYATPSDCPVPNITIRVLPTAQQCIRPQMTIKPIDELACPAALAGVSPDTDQGWSSDIVEACPYEIDVHLSPDDDQGEEGKSNSICPYVGPVILSPSDDQGEDGIQDTVCLHNMGVNVSPYDSQGEDAL